MLASHFLEQAVHAPFSVTRLLRRRRVVRLRLAECFVSGSGRYREVRPLLLPASAAGPSRLHALNRGALRRSSNGLFDARL